MMFIWMTLFALGIAGLDQWTKYLVVENIGFAEKVPVLDGIFHLTFVKNIGGAFSSFQGMRWMFVAIFAVLTMLMLYEYFKKPMAFTKFERWCIAAVYGGGLGNVIDRIFRSYVVDMIEVEFMEFAVFNVADCFITCGCIALLISMVFFNKQFWKEEKK